MSRRRISIKDLVNSRNQSPVPFTTPSVSLPPTFYFSSFAQTTASTSTSNTGQKYYVEKVDEYQRRKEIESRANEYCASPDPLNCISRPQQPFIKLPSPPKSTVKAKNRLKPKSTKPAIPTEREYPNPGPEIDSPPQLEISSQSISPFTLQVNLGSSSFIRSSFQDNSGTSLRLSISRDSSHQALDVGSDPIESPIDTNYQAHLVDPDNPNSIQLDPTTSSSGSSSESGENPILSVPCTSSPKSYVPAKVIFTSPEGNPAQKQSSQTSHLLPVKNTAISGFKDYSSSRESTLSPLPSSSSGLSPLPVTPKVPAKPLAKLGESSTSHSKSSEINEQSIVSHLAAPKTEDTTANHKGPPDKPIQTRLQGIEAIEDNKSKQNEDLKYTRKQDNGETKTWFEQSNRHTPILASNTTHTSASNPKAKERPSSLPLKPISRSSASSTTSPGGSELVNSRHLPPKPSPSPTKKVRKLFDLPPKPKTHTRAPSSQRSVQAPIVRRSARVALQATGSLEVSDSQALTASVEEGSGKQAPVSTSQIDSVSCNSASPDKSNSANSVLPVVSASSNTHPSHLESINRPNSPIMSPLPKRQSRKPQRYQSPLEDDDLESIHQSAPTPIESAPTPKDEGFSDSSLTPPPPSQVSAAPLPPIERSPVKNPSKKARGRPSRSASQAETSELIHEEGQAESSDNTKEEESTGIRDGEGETKVAKKRGRPPYKHLKSSTSDQLTHSGSTSNHEGSASPTKVTKIKLNLGNKAKVSSVDKDKLPDQVAERSASPPVKKASKGSNAKKRKSELHEPESTPKGNEPDTEAAENEAPKKLKISLKNSAGKSESPAPSNKNGKKRMDTKEDQEDAGVNQSSNKELDSIEAKPKLKLKSKKSAREYSSSESDDEEERIAKPKKKKKTARVMSDDEEEDQPKKKVQKVSKDQGEPKGKHTPLQKSASLPKTTNVHQTQKDEVERSISPERNEVHPKSSPPPKAKPLKKKPRPSEPLEPISKKSAATKGPDTPINKSEGLVRSKSITQLASTSNTNDEGQGSSKKPLPLKKPIPKPSGQTGTPVPAAKPSGYGAGLLGNTLALLQGTTSTPKAKDTKNKDNTGKEVKKDTPKAVRKGGWSDEWILTPEQEREYAASKAQRDAERKKREEWSKNPVNLQEAKDSYRVDSMQSRTIAVPGAMGIQTSGKSSAMIGALLGF